MKFNCYFSGRGKWFCGTHSNSVRASIQQTNRINVMIVLPPNHITCDQLITLPINGQIHHITVFLSFDRIYCPHNRWDKMTSNKCVHIFCFKGGRAIKYKKTMVNLIVSSFFWYLYIWLNFDLFLFLLLSSFNWIQEKKTHDLFSERSCRNSISALNLPVAEVFFHVLFFFYQC